MNQGFYLTLMMGGFNAKPVPQPVIDALTEIQVTSTVGAQGGFQLKLTMGRTSPLQHLLESGFFDPRQRVIIAVTVNGQTDVLMDGIITKQDLTPSNAAGKSMLSITGLDLTALMDFIDLTGIPYPALPMFVIVEMILAKYAVLGVVPIAIPPLLPLIQNPIARFMKQDGTDYAYVNKLASDVGAVFYLDPGPTAGMSIAYWGPDLSKLFGGPQPAHSINFDGSSTLDSISFSYDGTLATQYLVTVIEPTTHIPLPVPLPNIDLLKASLSTRAPTPLKSEQLRPIVNDDPVGAALTGLGALFKTADVVRASGKLDLLR
jgi:hypothetical protein